MELVIDADGLGTPAEKVGKYNLMTDSRIYPFIRFRGIKIFFPNPWEHAGHCDKPPMMIQTNGPEASSAGSRNDIIRA